MKYLIAWELILNFPFNSSDNSEANIGTLLLSSATTNSPSDKVKILKGVFSFSGVKIFLNCGNTSVIFSIAPGALSLQFKKSFLVNFLYSTKSSNVIKCVGLFSGNLSLSKRYGIILLIRIG